VISLEFNMLHMLNDAMEIQNTLLLFRIKRGLNPIADIVISGNSAACNIANDAWCNTTILLPLPLVEMGIMDNTRLLLTCAPGEGSMALWAPHLVTALNLCD
jgi:hypothetical protein